ncbi:hypothetical protein D9M71_594400 [compost metagenome]
MTWVGFDQPTTLGRREYGGIAALPIWINFMGQALQGTPSAWVRLDKDAQAPISRDKTQAVVEVSDKKTYRAAPPLARPLYRPAPPQPKLNNNNDFADLPGEEIVIPSKAAPPAMKPLQEPAPKREKDELENLINQIE